jgi:hypothetical protein
MGHLASYLPETLDTFLYSPLPFHYEELEIFAIAQP